MEVVVPVMAPSASCSPRTAAIAGGNHLLGYCYFSSAPTIPSRASYPGDASPGAGGDDATFDFTLGFNGQLQEATPILADADQVFEGGRPLPGFCSCSCLPSPAAPPLLLLPANGGRPTPHGALGAGAQTRAAPGARGTRPWVQLRKAERRERQRAPELQAGPAGRPPVAAPPLRERPGRRWLTGAGAEGRPPGVSCGCRRGIGGIGRQGEEAN